MKTLDSLNLIVPKLGRDVARKITGGMDGGYIQPSYCYGGSGSLSWDSWYYDYLFNHYDPDYGENYGGGGGSGYEGSYNDYDDSDDTSNITFGEGVSVAVQEEILDYIETLPEEFQKLKIKIEINEELFQKLEEEGKYGVALFLSAGRELNGTLYDEDTVILKSTEQIKDLFEELLHAWQYHNCWEDNANNNNTVNAMEFQSDVIEVIMHYMTDPDGIYASPNGVTDLSMKICELYDLDPSSFNADTLIDFLNSISEEQWQEYYDSWTAANKGNYNQSGVIDDSAYNWNWQKLLNAIGMPDGSENSSIGRPY